jgi:hypothetical protein
MIYKSYNFVESYSNADGTQKNGMVLSELGKVIRNEPNAVILALKDAGIRVPRRATRRDLIRLIVANKRNRKLAENLSILIVANSTAPNGVLPSGREKFDNLIDPSGREKFDNAIDPSRQTTYGPQTQAESEAESKKNPPIPYALPTQEGGGFFKNIGDFFKGRQEAKANKPKTLPDGTPAPSGFQRFQNWFNQNRGTIGQVAQTTYDSLNRGGVPNLGGGFNNTPPPIRQETWVERNRGVVIVGALAIIGGVIYFATRKKA